MAVTQWLEVERFLEKRPLWKLLSLGRGGQNVLAIGRSVDIEEAAHFDRLQSGRRAASRLVANRGCLMRGNRGISGWALPRSCPKER